MVIRRAIPDDAARLAELGARTFADAFAAQNTPENLAAYLAKTYGETQQRREISDPAIVTLVAEDADALIAFAQLKRDARGMEIARFYVDQRHHGRGLAQELMRAVEAAALASGAAELWLGVWEHNPRAIAFYAKCGFTDTGSQPFIVGDDVQTDRVMVKGL